MLHHGRLRKERSHNRAPFGKCGRLAKAHGVVFQRRPNNLQHIALSRLNAFVNREALKALGVVNHGGQTALNGFFKGGVLAGLDANVSEFEDHGLVFAKTKRKHKSNLGVSSLRSLG